MIKDIKDIEIGKRQEELAKYQQMDEKKKGLDTQIEQLDSQANMQSQMIQYKHFTLFQRWVTQRRKYKEYKTESEAQQNIGKSLEDKISQLREEIKGIYEQKRIGKVEDRKFELKDEISRIRKSYKTKRLRINFAGSNRTS